MAEKDAGSTGKPEKDLSAASEIVPEIDIPNLKKKKEEEKKKAGVAWGQAAKGGSFQGARGAAGAASSAARSAASAAVRSAAEAGLEAGAEVAAEAAAASPGFFSSITALLATPLGKMIAAAAIAVVVGVAAAVMRGGNPATQQAAGGPNLGGVSSSIKVPQQADNGLSYAARAAKGELKFDGPQKPAGAPATPENKDNPEQQANGGAPVPEGGAAPDGQVAQGGGADMGSTQGGMAHSYGKLSSSFGGGASQGGAGGPTPGGFKGKQLSAMSNGDQRGSGVKGKMSQAASNRSATMKGNWRYGKSLGSRALAQLRGMNKFNQSLASRSQTSEAASQTAQTQFEGTEMSNTAEAPKSPVDAAPSANTPGLGSGGGGGGCQTGCSGPEGDMGMITTAACTCACPEGTTLTGGKCGAVTGIDKSMWSGMLETVYGMIDSSVMALIIASVLFIAGEAMAVAMCVATACCGGFAGWAWMIGVLIAGLIAMYVAMAQADAMDKIADQIKATGAANPIAEEIHNIASDIRTKAWLTIVAGLGGILSYQILEEKKKLKSTAEGYLQ